MSGHRQTGPTGPFRAINGNEGASFDHLVGAREQRRQSEAQHLRSS